MAATRISTTTTRTQVKSLLSRVAGGYKSTHKSQQIRNHIVAHPGVLATHIVNHSHPPLAMLPANSKVQFYRRVLPDTCISFSSEEGKRIFTESLLAGFANIYFPLAEQFRTQDEPAYCGLSTLVMALNTLEVDPKRVWKGPWRWYHENMLDCCFPLDLVQQKGITMDQFICLATCNYLDLNVVRMNEEGISLDDFRKTIKEICSGAGKLLICSYSRKGLSQTGDGHFSPIGAYYEKEDLCLVMDVARYKYPPHWIKVTSLWESMKYFDKVTELPRGYMIMRKTEELPLMLFRLSTTFRVTIATHDVSRSHMAIFLKSWKSFLSEDQSCECSCETIVDVVSSALKALNEALSSLLEGESIFTTQFNTCCMSILHSEHVDSAKRLLAALEGTDVYRVTDNWLKEFKINNPDVGGKTAETAPNPCSDTSSCCRLTRVGKSIADAAETNVVSCSDEKCDTEHEKHAEEEAEAEVNKCGSTKEHFVNDSHYITMLLFAWPYEMELGASYAKCLSTYVDKTLSNCTDELLVNESKQLKQQIQSLVSMVKDNA